METKKCIVCDTKIHKKVNTSKIDWSTLKFCTKECYWRNLKGKRPSNTTHNMKHTRIYEIWSGMKKRCNNPNSQAYKYYGGKGIEVCERWNEFMNFYEDTIEGYNDNLSIDRINGDLGYSKENCRWATDLQQSQNRKNVRFITYRGETKTVPEWGRQLGIRYNTIRRRLVRGWTVEESLSK